MIAIAKAGFDLQVSEQSAVILKQFNCSSVLGYCCSASASQVASELTSSLQSVERYLY